MKRNVGQIRWIVCLKAPINRHGAGIALQGDGTAEFDQAVTGFCNLAGTDRQHHPILATRTFFAVIFVHLSLLLAEMSQGTMLLAKEYI
jgi:hypothetical protein